MHSVTEQETQTGFVVTDELLAYMDYCELRDRGRTLGVVGFSDRYGWFAAVAADGGWRTLDCSTSEVQARQRVHAVAGGGRWRRVDSLHDTAW